MKLIILLSLILTAQISYADVSEIKKIEEMVADVNSSLTLRDWHKHKERLETKGYQLWLEHKDDPSFCENIDQLGFLTTEAMLAWNHASKSACGDELLARHNDFLAQVRHIHQFDYDDLELQVCNPDREPREKLGPTREKNLDTTGGPFMIRGDLAKCEVALTFDDGPHPTRTPALLQILEAQDVKANFFNVGRNVDRHPTIADNTAKAGHVVGNHSHSHKNLPDFSFEVGKQEITKGFQSLLNIWDFTTPFFRFPYGAFTRKTRQFNKSNNVAEFFWNMDTRDWGIKNRRELLINTFKEIDRERRGILLFHDVQAQTIDIMPKVLRALKKAGYTTAVFVPEDLIEGQFPQ